MQGFGLLLLRIVLSLTFLAHGLPKLFPLWGTSPQTTAALFEAASFTPAYPLAVGTGIVEVLAGLLLIVGAYTFWACALLVATTSVIAWKLHVPHGFFVNWSLTPETGHGYEFAFVLTGALVCLMCSGPGSCSIDHRRTVKRR
jgi:putative oxidoreductase